MSEKIRVLIADDHAIVRKGLRILMMNEPDLTVVGEASDGMEAVLKTRALQPDVIILDMLMPRLNGVAATRQIREENPCVRILILTGSVEDDTVIPALKAGAMGYVRKEASPDQLLQAIRDIVQAKCPLDSAVARQLIHEMKRTTKPELEIMSERELEILKLVAQGLSNQEIAHILIMSERTVGNHVSTILSKLNLSNRTQAALYALRTGIAQLNEFLPDPQ